MRKRIGTAMLAAAASLFFDAPAQATVMPPVGLADGESAWSAGLLTGAVDVAVAPGITAGVALTTLGLVSVAGVRGSYRLWTNGSLAVGATLSLGVLENLISTYHDMAFAQPQLDFAWSPTETMTLRFSAGSQILYVPELQTKVTMMWWEKILWNPYPLPNLEVAYRIDPATEVTIGGGSVGSLRRRWK